MRGRVRRRVDEFDLKPKLPDGRGMLCIGCLELRLGRELNAADFKDCGLTRTRGLSRRSGYWIG